MAPPPLRRSADVRVGRRSHWWSVLIVLGLLAPAPAAVADADPLRLEVDGVRADGAIAGSCAGNPTVDLRVLAGPMRLTIDAPAADGSVRVSPVAGGSDWIVRPGMAGIEVDGRIVPMACPAQVTPASLVLPLTSVADLGGWIVEADELNGVVFLRRGWESVEPTDDADWTRFVQPKTELETALGVHLEDRGSVALVPSIALPDATTPLRVGLGLGYVQGADSAMELSMSGLLAGLDTRLAAFLSSGPRGVEMHSGHVVMADPDRGWSVEAGDLFSPLHGTRRGLRLGLATIGRHQPSLSLYLDGGPTGGGGRVAGVADRLVLGSGLRVDGEVLSSGATFAGAGFDRRRFRIDLYRRDPGGDRGVEVGGTVVLALPRGVSLQLVGGEADVAGGDRDWSTVSLRLPIGRQSWLSMERSESASGATRSEIRAIGFGMPLGGVRLHGRYQHRDVERVVRAAWVRESSHELNAVASVRAGRDLFIQYQATAWQGPSGAVDVWDSLAASWRASRRLRLDLDLSPSDADRLENVRIRAAWEVRTGLHLAAEYGPVMPFQGVGAEPGATGLTLFVRTSFVVDVPAAGAEIAGRVTDSLGGPLDGVVLRLGPYLVLSDRDGSYRFAPLAPGGYVLTLDPGTLPAGCGAPAPVERHVAVDGRRRVLVDFVAPVLTAVEGRVWVDRDGDGRQGPAEGVKAVLHLADRKTASDAGGRFAFHGVAPGAHTVRLDARHLPGRLEPRSALEVAVLVEPGQPTPEVVFELTEPERPVVWQ